MANEDTVQLEFYAPWPNLGKKFSQQLGQIRTDTAHLAPLVRSFGFDASGDFSNLDSVEQTAVQAFEIGEQDFHNRFRIHYDKTGNIFDIDTNTTTSGEPNWYTIWSVDSQGTVFQVGVGSGEANTASNLGAGEGVFAAKAGADLRFKSLVEGSNITLTSTGSDITIAAASTSSEQLFYLTAKHSDDTASFGGLNLLAFNVDNFYLTQNSLNTDEVIINLRDDTDDTGGAGGGDVTKVGTPVDNQIGVWTGDGTIEGTSTFTYTTSALTLTGAIVQTFGTRNVIIGDSTAGNGGGTLDSIVIGDGAGASMTGSGIRNVVIGTNTGASIIQADGCVIIGYNAGTAIVTQPVVFIGKDAGKLQTGSGATYIGFEAGANNVTPTRHTFLGYQAGKNITGGSGSVLIGYQAGVALTTPSASNIIIGEQAGSSLQTGISNILIGKDAGQGIVTGSTNTIVGNNAGDDVTGSGNVFLGFEAGSKQVAIDNKFIVDNQLRSNAAADLTDSLIVGTFDATPENQTLTVNADFYMVFDLDHDGSNVGFFGTTPVVQAGAYTQTYSIATATHSNPTGASLTDSSGGTPDQTVSPLVAISDTSMVAINGSGMTTAQEAEYDAMIVELNTALGVANDNFAEATDEINKLVIDVANVKQVLNQVIDDLQTYGLVQ